MSPPAQDPAIFSLLQLFMCVTLLALWYPGFPVWVEGRRLPEHHCRGGGIPGDKWFDGCQWCVCTTRGNVCSQSHCSTGLVKKVAPCHVMGQRWIDGCYECTCKRHGIACRLDAVCHLLRHNPVPCLSDDRCVCGPDGVPSCTAEVIDMRTFSAKRVDVGLSAALLEPEMEIDDLRKYTSDNPPISTTQELLITSDNLCRFGPRWYGGSLRCFCDIDGSITCGNPAFVTAFFDDFKVRKERCEEGHAWEEACTVCSCRVNGVIFCRRDQKCRSRLLDTRDIADEDSGDYVSGIDHYLSAINNEYEDGEEEMMLPSSPSANHPSPRVSESRWKEGQKAGAECEPGTKWRDGCKRCLCADHGRVVCHQRHCRDNRSEGGVNLEDEESEIEGGHNNHKQDGGRSKEDTGMDIEDGSKYDSLDDGEKSSNEQQQNRINDAFDRPATIKPFTPRGPRGPMMIVPVPPGHFPPPAYVVGAPEMKFPCGRFKVGDKYWELCNLCLCTARGPKCEGKLCR